MKDVCQLIKCQACSFCEGDDLKSVCNSPEHLSVPKLQESKNRGTKTKNENLISRDERKNLVKVFKRGTNTSRCLRWAESILLYSASSSTVAESIPGRILFPSGPTSSSATVNTRKQNLPDIQCKKIHFIKFCMIPQNFRILDRSVKKIKNRPCPLYVSRIHSF